jgi:glycogen operon protein
VEGPTSNPAIVALRERQARNLIATLLISQGVPMLLGGDEFLRTQGGNNNAWCQDNATGWVDWKFADRHAGFTRFIRMMIALRKRHPVLRRNTFLRGASDGQPPEIVWHGVEPGRPDFGHDSRSIAMALDGRGCDRAGVVDRDLFVIFNAYWEPLKYTIPASPTGRRWRRAIDTARPAPDDALAPDTGPVVAVKQKLRVESRSLVILVSESN